LPGGGGYGPAGDRDPDAARRDLAAGYITESEAHEVYGLDAAPEAPKRR